MPAAARSKLCSSVSAWLGVFASFSRPYIFFNVRSESSDKEIMKNL